MTRDPITYPRKGDVLRQGKTRLRVLEVEKYVHYEVTTEGARGFDAIPVQCMLTPKQWAKTVADYQCEKAATCK